MSHARNTSQSKKERCKLQLEKGFSNQAKKWANIVFPPEDLM
jgi:hypothetical protein